MMIKRYALSLFLLVAASAFSQPTTLVYDLSSDHTILETTDTNEIKSIASITKLMTAIVVLESGAALEEKIPYPTPRSKTKLSRQELLYRILIRSDNRAATSLANGGGGQTWFVYQMNKKAEELDLYSTKFNDPSGIGVNNKSTAQDLVILLNYAFNYDIIRELSSMSSYSFDVPGKNFKANKSKQITGNNTNHVLLEEFKSIKLSKTGTTTAAGKCVAMIVITESYRKIAIVILGAKTRNEVNKIARQLISNL